LGVDASDGHPVSVPPNPMILGIEALIPHQGANTRDSCINKMIYYRTERGGVISAIKAIKNRSIIRLITTESLALKGRIIFIISVSSSILYDDCDVHVS
jgi:hypothetical protein